ncbi:hypothetical protein K474DRAFT_1663475 [Panus rudis PR-1116 ss-1]|nr:hypothetical protein K474DRAFT_1663475 [Panus rudis PR-1116 ss-1]
MTSSVPKAALYVYKQSVWASVPLLALEEKGYGPDEVDIKEVDLHKGENFRPEYLRLNPHGTVPTLVVPLQTTLSSDIESRYKAIHDSKAIAEFLDKSRSTQSRTHTTSSAPSPALTPATISFTSTSNRIIELLHSEAGDPNALVYMNARDDASLKVLAKELLPTLKAKRATLDELIQGNDASQTPVSEKTLKFWELKKTASDGVLSVLEDAEKSIAELSAEAKAKREEYYKAANAAWSAVKEVLLQLHKELIGPYALGDQMSLADLHLAAFFFRLAKLAGASAEEDGDTVVGKLETHIGGGFHLPKELSVAETRRRVGLPATNVQPGDRQNKFAAFWDAIKERPSWKKVYGGGLH